MFALNSKIFLSYQDFYFTVRQREEFSNFHLRVLLRVRMQRCRFLVFLTMLLLSGAQSQDTTEQPTPSTTPWNGDPALCQPDSFTTPVPQKPQPNFATKAEFTIERIERRKLLNISLPATISYQQHIFDYDANVAVIVKNENGLITAEYYDYKVLRKSTFYAGTFCTVTDIEKNNDMSM